MFVVIGVIGVVLLLLTIVFDDFLDAVIPDSCWFSGPALGAFLAAFGLFGGGIETSADVASWVTVLGGIGGGVLLGYFTYVLGKALWAPAEADASN